MNLCTKFHPNQKMVKLKGKIFWGGISQGGGKFRGGILKKKNENLHNADAKQAFTRKFIQIGQWESGQIYGSNFWGKISQGGGKFGGRISKKNENLQISIQK